jgi:transcriptional regulator with XRE-family HTH domain
MTRRSDPTPLARLGYAVHLQRARLRISQGEAAKRSGMHRNYIGAIERGEINPTYDTLLRLSRGLDLPLHELVEQATATIEVVPVRQRRGGRPAVSAE